MSRAIFQIYAVRARIFRRFLVEHGFVLFILGPMVVGAVSWVAYRYLDLLREPMLRWLDVSAGFPDRASVILGLLLAALLWPSSLREVFGQRGAAQDLLDILPVTEIDRFAVSWMATLTRSLGFVVVFMLGLWSLEQEPSFFLTAPQAMQYGLVLALAVSAIAVLNLLLVAVWVPLGWATTGRWIAAVGVIAAMVVSPWAWTLWLLTPWAWSGGALKAALALALGSQNAVPPALGVPALHLQSVDTAALCLVLLVSSLGAGALFIGRRRRDLERAQALDLPRSRSGLPWVGAARRLPFGLGSFGLGSFRLAPSTAAQLRRDLLMILRRFSPAVPAALALTLFADLTIVAIAFDNSLPELWVRRGMVSAAFLGTLCLLSLIPFLLKAQLPVFWLEKSTGVALEHVWQTKWLLAGLITVPQILVAGTLIFWLSPGGWIAVAISSLQLVSTALIAATFIGLAVFEIAEQPILGLLFSGFVATAISSLMIFYPQAWWLWLIFFGYLVSLLSDRASRRVRYTEVEL